MHSTFTLFMKVVAFIVLMIGVIGCIKALMDGSGLDWDAMVTSLGILLSSIVTFSMLYGISIVIDRLDDLNEKYKASTHRLVTSDENAVSNSNLDLLNIPPSNSEVWVCRNCGTSNPKQVSVCKACGELRNAR